MTAIDAYVRLDFALSGEYLGNIQPEPQRVASARAVKASSISEISFLENHSTFAGKGLRVGLRGLVRNQHTFFRQLHTSIGSLRASVPHEAWITGRLIGWHMAARLFKRGSSSRGKNILLLEGDVEIRIKRSYISIDIGTKQMYKN